MVIQVAVVLQAFDRQHKNTLICLNGLHTSIGTKGQFVNDMACYLGCARQNNINIVCLTCSQTYISIIFQSLALMKARFAHGITHMKRIMKGVHVE